MYAVGKNSVSNTKLSIRSFRVLTPVSTSFKSMDKMALPDVSILPFKALLPSTPVAKLFTSESWVFLVDTYWILDLAPSSAHTTSDAAYKDGLAIHAVISNAGFINRFSNLHIANSLSKCKQGKIVCVFFMIISLSSYCASKSSVKLTGTV